ncbi:MAG: hypothetical protein FJZ92_12145 [Chloroflexi bacterium]|nr:hypothetical protein [Chloroflexota bacterium]
MNESRIPFALTREEAGTLLGSLAWVMGALQIMRDRGHAEEDEEFHELHDLLAPRLEALVGRIAAARQAASGAPAVEAKLEAAYSAIREAFETWIQLTAYDTLSAAVAERLEGETGIDPSPPAGA